MIGTRRRAAAALAALGTLALALPASARVVHTASGHRRLVEITNSGPVEAPSCPASPCAVVSKTTAMQVRDGSDQAPFVIARKGRIEAWSVTLALPSSAQIHYFDVNEGGTSRAALAILRPVGGTRFELIAESPTVHLQPDFGTTARITLRESIPVVKGDVVALAVSTWLPALAVDYPPGTSWRASRAASACTAVQRQTAQRVIGSKVRYGCLYDTALLTYGATEAVSG